MELTCQIFFKFFISNIFIEFMKQYSNLIESDETIDKHLVELCDVYDPNHPEILPRMMEPADLLIFDANLIHRAPKTYLP